MDEQQLMDLKKQIEKDESKLENYQGQLDQLLEYIQEQGYNDEDELEKEIENINKEIEKQEKKQTKLITQIREKLDQINKE